MTKLDMSLKIAQRVGAGPVVAKQIVQMTLDAIIEVLATEGRLELRDFGIFEVYTAKARKGRNPRTGVEVMVPERRCVRFKAGKLMEERGSNGAVAVGPTDSPAT
jgi:nucleoid DNA-binding protein